MRLPILRCRWARVWSAALSSAIMTLGRPRHRRFGAYILLQRSGAGGMGSVDVAISARARGMQRLCVVKRIRADLKTDDQETRFRREAEIAIGLSHGAIAQTLDVEEIDGELCILQEYIHGTTLSYLETRAASQAPLPVALTLHVISEVTRALAYAHNLPGPGIVHRDVTPDNIMLSFTGEVKLIDFGIAKVVGDESLTQARVVVGRPLFTAPETLAGREADHRADIYSVGVVLWMSLTGRQFPDIFEKGVAPAPSSLNLAVGQDVDNVCFRALAINPEERYQSAEDLLDAMATLPRGPLMHDRKISAFLAKHFDVDEERRQLARDIELAGEMLNEPTRVASSADLQPVPTPLDAPPAHSSLDAVPKRSLAVPLSLGGGLLAGAAAATLVALAAWPVPRHAAAAPVCPPVATVRADTRAVPQLAPVIEQVQPPPAAPAGPGRIDRKPFRKAPHRLAPVPSVSPPSPSGEELLRDAGVQLKAGAFDRAFGLASAAAQAGAGAPAHLIMGKVFFSKSDLTEAEAEFRKVTALRPDDREAASFLEAIRKQAAHGP